MEFSLLNLLLILCVAWLAGVTASRLGYPSVLGELAAGMIFGPPLLGIIHGDDGTALLGRLGVLLMMLFIGTRIDIQDLAKAAGSALLTTLLGFLVPFVAGYGVALAFGGSSEAGLLVGTALGLTALATVPRIVVDLDLVETRVGQTLMAVALFSVVVVLVAFSASLGVIKVGGLQWGELALVLGKALLFLVLAAGIGLYGFPRLGRLLLRANTPGRTDDFTLAILYGVAMAILAEQFGLHLILGAFLAGLFLRADMFEGGFFQELLTVVRDVSLGFLTPLFFLSAGFSVSFSVFATAPFLLVAVVLSALLGKILAGVLASVIRGQSWREGFVIGCGMNGRGGLDIVIAGVGLELGVLSQEMFTTLVVASFLTTLCTPVLLKWGAGWLRQRSELVLESDMPEVAPSPAAAPAG